MPIGNDIGFLPGDKMEKMDPWIQPIFDALGFITKEKKALERLKEIVERN